MKNKYGFVRVAAGVSELRVADVDHNLRALTATIRQAARQQVEFLVLPELGVTGYSCGDLFAQKTLLRASREALPALAQEAKRAGLVAVVGLPLTHRGRLYNCGVVLAGGKVAGIVPKQYLLRAALVYPRSRSFGLRNGTPWPKSALWHKPAFCGRLHGHGNGGGDL
jgi:NAD+ synthase (glutamine-hydrolysing)